MVSLPFAATFTGVPAFAVVFLTNLTTAATYLAGIPGIDEQHVPTSVCSFIGTELLEHCPSSINDTLVSSTFRSRSIGERHPVFVLLWPGAFAPRGGLQRFKHHRCVGVYQLPPLLVQEVKTLVSDFPIGLRSLLHGLLAPVGAAFFA